MENDLATLHTIKVNKALTCIMWVAAFAFSLVRFIGVERVHIAALICVYVFALIATLILFWKKFMTILSYILASAFLVFVVNSEVIPAMFIPAVIVSVCTAALYINKKLFMVFGIVLANLEVIFLQFSQNIYKIESFIRVIIHFEVVIIILFLLTKWGSERIERLSAEAGKRKKLLNELDEIFGAIKADKMSLDESIEQCYIDAVRLNRKKNIISELISNSEECILKHTADERKNGFDKEILRQCIVLIEEALAAAQDQEKDIKSLCDKIQNIKRLSEDLYIIDVFSKAELFLRLKD
jgi:hypothetical protein